MIMTKSKETRDLALALLDEKLSSVALCLRDAKADAALAEDHGGVDDKRMAQAKVQGLTDSLDYVLERRSRLSHEGQDGE